MSIQLTPTIILTVLRSFAVPAIDANEVDRDARLQTIAAAEFAAAERATCTGAFAVPDCKPIARDAFQVAAETIGLAYFETHLAGNVHRDQCRRFECDPVKFRLKGKVIVYHRARSLWQLQRAPEWPQARWDSYSGVSLEATTAAAWQATVLMQGYRGMCHNGTIGAFAGYATGGKCTHKDAARRAREVERIRMRLVGLAMRGEP